jgi:CYTH domain-containing protein
MEIERKFLLRKIPFELEQYKYLDIEQGYLCTNPVLRIRRKGASYIFTYKSAGLMAREEIEVPLTRDSYEHLVPKCDGSLITKTRYHIPDRRTLNEGEYMIELDVFHGALDSLLLAEVEFHSEAEAHAYIAPDWFAVEVTSISTFHNSHMSETSPADILRHATRLLNEEA